MTFEQRVLPAERLSALRRTIEQNGVARIMEAHSGLSAIIADTTRVSVNGEKREFDGLWESSLTDSATKGLPDASIVGTESRLHTIDEILHVATKPMIVDGDTGGEVSQFANLVTHLERKGVSAVIIEDKVFPKRNSLDPSASQELEDPDVFADKIDSGKRAALSRDFLVIARIESLIAGTGLDDAVTRAERYIEAGVDGIMIHSNRREPADLFAFAEGYEALCTRMGRRPLLVSVPTTYNHHPDDELASLGFDVVIHANQLLRASHGAMKEAARLILETGSSAGVDEICTPVKEVFSVVGYDRITAEDRDRSQLLNLPVIIPSSGRDQAFPEQPKSLIQVGGRPVLDYQLESVRKVGLKKVVVVRGHEGEQFAPYTADENLVLCENPFFDETHALHSLMQAEDQMEGGFALVFSDILFDADILSQLVASGGDIVLGIDNSYVYHKHNVDKRLDLVVSRKSFDGRLRSLRPERLTDVVRMGKNIELEQADYEFIGMAYFSQEGARKLADVYRERVAESRGGFHEADSFKRAGITDILQELIERGFLVEGLEVRKGWLEIHNREDVEVAESELSAMLTPR